MRLRRPPRRLAAVEKLGVRAAPFERVRYFAPFTAKDFASAIAGIE